ncbi:MAG: DUF4388 domain-containing protein [Desulfobacteraceae bacterium]|nr:MAG: DUF4388 domain-containing protein [Desulfobacteraceae bacterium]
MNRRPELAGDLEFVSLADLLQVLGGGNSTGTLYLASEFSQDPGEVRFVSGEIVDAKWGRSAGVNAVYSFFGWQQGRFEFRQQQFSGRRTIRKGRMEIVLDALRMLDDGLVKRIGSPRRRLDHPSGPLRSFQKDLPLIRGNVIDYSFILAEESFEDQTRIVSEGSHGNWIWVILEGRALVSREEGGKEIPILHLGEGSFIGGLEMLVFGDHVRTSTVTAVGKVKAALLDTHRLSNELMALSPEFRRSLLNMSAEAKKISDDLLQLLTGGRSPSRHGGMWGYHQGESSFGWIRKISEKGWLQHDSFRKEAERLSRTFKGLTNCTSEIILATSRRVQSIHKRTTASDLTEQQCKTG